MADNKQGAMPAQGSPSPAPDMKPYQTRDASPGQAESTTGAPKGNSSFLDDFYQKTVTGQALGAMLGYKKDMFSK